MSSPVRVRSLGRFAQAALVRGNATVIALFERSAYVETAAGLACIGNIGNGPLNAQCDALPGGLKVGDAVRADLAGAKIWSPQLSPEFNAATVRKSLARLQISAQSQLPSEGFGYLLDPARERPKPVQALMSWLEDPRGEPEGAAGLIGLGPGLTPSGDDLIGGALCALHATGSGEAMARLAAWALPLAGKATNRISQAHLACAAQGECGEAVNDAIVALLSGDAPDLARIDAIGHTSGWDALAGVGLALHALVHRSPCFT
jgi:hypothetical protein